MSRYEAMFARLSERGEGAFIPFLTPGDPDPERSLESTSALVEAGADALELGIPFSDPIADGPTIQAAAVRALKAGATPSGCFELLERLRPMHPETPFGLLVYANLVVGGGLEEFYRRAAAAGVDSVLVADVPTVEAEPFVAAAREHGVAPVFIAPPNADEARLARIAELSQGYTYVVTRGGVTGAREEVELTQASIPARLRALGAPPPVFGFGISRPEHVRAALDAGAAGAISGSAVVAHLEAYCRGELGWEETLETMRMFVSAMKAATR